MTSVPDAPKMRLVGCMAVKGADWDLESFGNLYGRLAREVKHAGSPMRYIGYKGITDKQCSVRFFGVEVDHIDDIPKGMVGWDLCGGTWAVLHPADGQNGALFQEGLTWQWSNKSPSGSVTGEFSALCSAEWSERATPALHDFHITSNAYFVPGKDVDDDVRLVDYDASWPRQFEGMAHRIREMFAPDVALRVEHYGSTSIPGMPAKPVIDILVEVPSFDEARRRAIPLFNTHECEYWSYSGHMVFIIREKLMGRRTHHIHMAPAGHDIWNGLAFRDHLRTHPEDAASYAALKHELAERHKTDREHYTRAKEAFVMEITAKALHES